MKEMENLSPETRMANYLKKIATGPELSKDLTLEEARDGMTLILEGLVSDIQAAVFLIALRMKRESDEENKGILEALRKATKFETVPIPECVELSDPFDGFNRHLPSSSFLPPILAACGLPTFSQGCKQLGPKCGVTHHQILTAAGAPVGLTPQQGASNLANPEIGWAYVDQKLSCPSLEGLSELRKQIAKRPCLSTLEKLCGPLRAQKKNHLFIGYVHRDYQRLLPLLARHASYDSALVIRGVEGGIVPPLNSTTVGTLYFNKGENQQMTRDPKEAGIEFLNRAVPIPSQGNQHGKSEEEKDNSFFIQEMAKASAKKGIEALEGTPGPTRESLVYTGAVLLHTLGRFETIQKAGNAIRKVLDSGEAKRRFQKGCFHNT